MTNDVTKGSWMRQYLSFYFWFIAVPLTWAIGVVFVVLALNNPESLKGVWVYLITFFILIHTFWALPKLFQKVVEALADKIGKNNG